MTNDPLALRRYLLGTSSDEERHALEDGYFESAAALEKMEDAEDVLVESYLDGSLTADERAAFEQHYLASPLRRRRVEVTRGLRPPAVRWNWTSGWSGLGLAAAAVLAVTIAGLVWLTGGRTRPRPDAPVVADGPGAVPSPTPDSTPRTPLVVALVIPPVAVRGSGGPPTARLLADADLLELRLLSETGQPPVAEPLVVVETIEGREVWQGPGSMGEGVTASVPANRLVPGDYLAVLFDTSGGRRTERNQYFFRVQRPAGP